MIERPSRAAGPAALFLAAALTTAALVAFRPHLAGPVPSWPGDELAIGTTWLVATAYAAWLTIVTALCLLATARGRHAFADRVARAAPPVARRVLQAALVGTWALLPAAAYAAPSTPLVVHVGPGGRLTIGSRPAA